VFGSECGEDLLSKNWQRLVLTHLEEKTHKGVLTGSPITDMKITLVAGKAHIKHTEGGDFREATYRAVRQGLMEADSILLEPYYAFQLELPEKSVGRAMNDIEKMYGTCEVTHSDGNMAILSGSAPVTAMRNYQKEVTVYTKGLGRITCSFKGYERCHNEAEVIEAIGYDPERDFENPASSVFCSSGSGFLVDWYKVKNFMHVESCFTRNADVSDEAAENRSSYKEEQWISQEEIKQIFNRTFYANQGKKTVWKRHKAPGKALNEPSAAAYADRYNMAKESAREEYLLVDGYNVIYAWPDLKELADKNMDSARVKLLDTLCNYQGVLKCEVIVVFDAYRVLGHQEEVLNYHNIRVVYTKEAQTADQYIEKFSYDNKKKYTITVATSDGLQQVIIRGAGAALLSARDLKADVERINTMINKQHQQMQGGSRNLLSNSLSPEAKQKLKDMIKGENEQ
jgi:predicted RNA-binding protein with PIN domain